MLGKKIALKYLTDELGEIYIDDNKIICLVDENKIKDKKNIIFNKLNDRKRRIIKRYNLTDKEIVYLIRGMDFNSNISIQSLNGATIYIIDSLFNKSFSINAEGNINIDNIIFNTGSLCDITADNININNIIVRKNVRQDPILLGIYAKNNLNIKYSHFGYSFEKLHIMLKANNEMMLENVIIDSENAKIEAGKLVSIEDYYIAENGMIINSDLYNIGNIHAKKVVLNGTKYDDELCYSFSNECNNLEMKRK